MSPLIKKSRTTHITGQYGLSVIRFEYVQNRVTLQEKLLKTKTTKYFTGKPIDLFGAEIQGNQVFLSIFPDKQDAYKKTFIRSLHTS